MRRVVRVLAFAAALTLALGACGSDKDTGLGAGPTEAPVGKTCPTPIEMIDQPLTFVPNVCTVKAGETVTWVTIGSAPHTVTHEDGKTFDSGATDTIAKGEEFKFTFATPGEYPYYCRLHAAAGTRTGMVGTVTVEAV
jgi:plastocyanin